MSSGNFTTVRYKTDAGNVHRIRVQPETVSLALGATANSPTTDELTPNLPSARARASKRIFGVVARSVTLRWIVIPDGYQAGTVTVPILQKTVFDALPLGGVVDYLSGSGEIVGKSNESIR